MTCEEARLLVHALVDAELDAGHAQQVEAHLAGCPACAAELAAAREIKQAMTAAELRHAAPAELRRRIEATLPRAAAPNRRAVLGGFALGSAVSALAASGFVAIVLRGDDEQRIMSEIVTAHLRSLQPGHLTDVVSTDRHTVKPWFNGRVDVAPPVIDLAAQGFTLVGGRLDTLEARAVGAVVYRRRAHVINLFVAQAADTAHVAPRTATVQGYNIRRWRERGLQFWAVSDIGADELAEFVDRFEAASKANAETG